MQNISREQLQDWIDQNKDFELINVLGKEAFSQEHIPRSRNIPVGHPNFEQAVEQEAGGKDREIVVYCASPECDASPKAAKKLEEAGFNNVYDFEGGVQEWKGAGLELASA